MVLIRVNKNSYQVLGKGNLVTLFALLEEYTIQNENKQKFLVNEEKDNNCIIREFANQNQGLIETLIICGGIAKTISLEKSNKNTKI